MSDQYWSWILGFVGLIGFWLAGKKVWWCWYVNIANQVLWTAYSLITNQLGFLVATAFYFWVFSKNAYSWTKEHFEANKPNRDNYCYGSWEGDNWVAKACTVPRVPHAPHTIPEQDQGWDFNRVALPQVELYDSDAVQPQYEAISLEGFKVYPKTSTHEPMPEPERQTPTVMCTGRPRHPLCDKPVVGHKPHMVHIPNTPEE